MHPLQTLWDDVRELSLGTTAEISRLPSPPSPLNFLRDFVSANKPCLISSALRHWPALSNWSDDSYLIRSLSSHPSDDPSLVSLHLTPNGRADALAPHPTDCGSDSLCFASAHVERVPIGEALEMIGRSGEGFVAYAQQQNDCLRSEYSELAADCEEDIPWATEALGGCLPEAVNLWIGNQFSETSFHKDHYENLYAVVSGEKHFVLLPPTDVHRMYIRSYPAAHYSYSKEDRKFTLELDEPARDVPWCSVNPHPSLEVKDSEVSQFPMYFKGPKPFEVTVKAGEILYLPSMWFHHVRQSPDSQGRTIAINYWYDMQFDIKYAYFSFLQSMRFVSMHNSKSQNQAPADEAGSNLKDYLHINGSIPNLIESFEESEDF
uniref:JmjC domain-containing protein n=2 Tax=Kalanchoe fedtschenkoi TaxID=63787 RepID=A0A7N0SWW6_KALFE